MKITVDYDDDAERKRLESLNAGVFPLAFQHVDEFVLCGTRTPGVPVMHRHGNPSTLIRHAVVLTEDLRIAIMQQLVKAASNGKSDT